MTEAALQRRIVEALRGRGCYVVKVVHAGHVGVPDLLCCYRGRFIALEVKLPGERPTAIQLVQIREITNAEGFAYVVFSVTGALNVLAVVDAELGGDAPTPGAA